MPVSNLRDKYVFAACVLEILHVDRGCLLLQTHGPILFGTCIIMPYLFRPTLWFSGLCTLKIPQYFHFTFLWVQLAKQRFTLLWHLVLTQVDKIIFHVNIIQKKKKKHGSRSQMQSNIGSLWAPINFKKSISGCSVVLKSASFFYCTDENFKCQTEIKIFQSECQFFVLYKNSRCSRYTQALLLLQFDLIQSY